jgi:plasmid stabilization system protein ParE
MRYRISRQADRDLDGIWRHIAVDSEDAANRVDEAIHFATRSRDWRGCRAWDTPGLK